MHLREDDLSTQGERSTGESRQGAFKGVHSESNV
jgi:hypothetical protein